MVVRKESKTLSGIRRLTMSLPKSVSVFIFSLTLISNIYVAMSSDGLNPSDFAAADKLEGISLNPPAAASNSTVFRVNTDSVLALNLVSLLPENQEISVYCRNLLGIFGQRYVASIDCFVPAARPVKVCQNCFSAYGSLRGIYVNISEQVCCRKTSPFLWFPTRPPFSWSSSSLTLLSADVSHDRGSRDVSGQIWGNANPAVFLCFCGRESTANLWGS